MKKTFFALAFLVPQLATAAVTLNITARCAGDETNQTVELSKEHANCSLEHTSGVRTLISLDKEGEEAVDLGIQVTRGEQELSRSSISTAYGQEATLHCTSENVDASLTIVASAVN